MDELDDLLYRRWRWEAAEGFCFGLIWFSPVLLCLGWGKLWPLFVVLPVGAAFYFVQEMTRRTRRELRDWRPPVFENGKAYRSR
jgi:hypothetical protein